MTLETTPDQARVDAALDAFRLGQPIIVADPSVAGHGGVVMAAAERTSDGTVNFMVTHARGLLGLALTPERIERLGLGQRA